MPRTRDRTDTELLDRLVDVFRKHGYEGASLTLISKATGLERASLYHRFPGGKAEMAEAVLGHASEWLATHALEPLQGPGEPERRIRAMSRALREFYGGGEQSCLLDALSLGGDDDPIREHVETATRGWIGALARVVREAGFPAREARRRAEDAVARIQGTLVLSRAIGDTGPFRRTLHALPRQMLAEARGG